MASETKTSVVIMSTTAPDVGFVQGKQISFCGGCINSRHVGQDGDSKTSCKMECPGCQRQVDEHDMWYISIVVDGKVGITSENDLYFHGTKSVCQECWRDPEKAFLNMRVSRRSSWYIYPFDKTEFPRDEISFEINTQEPPDIRTGMRKTITSCHVARLLPIVSIRQDEKKLNRSRVLALGSDIQIRNRKSKLIDKWFMVRIEAIQQNETREWLEQFVRDQHTRLTNLS